MHQHPPEERKQQFLAIQNRQLCPIRVHHHWVMQMDQVVALTQWSYQEGPHASNS